MQYALVDGTRREAFSGGRGDCPVCGAATLAKCGPRILHHWAHAGRRDCDLWWENETEWHRAWKSLFPAECREISHTAVDGEIHRADIKTPTGIVVEIQHSAMTDAERQSREAFYGNLVWVIDGRGFRDNFDIYHILPDPASEIARDLVWSKASRPMQGAARGLFFRLSEAQAEFPDETITKATMRGGFYHGIGEIETEVAQAYRGHHQYDWVRPRRAWLDATCPVYIDFGDDRLVRLETYDESGLRCIRLISKRKFVHDVITETDAHAIATRFYPLVPDDPISAGDAV
ncbi:CoiA-like domain protein [Sphingomonas sp. dw_22]|uniref:competence protein CoiA n=1 Tax=Sphingomonas sp. dw_22 TaxID=2721175 RepID=UPI001BD37689|nr:CoiA-like domain protein [Sphingomonas sp. dw_22]